MVIINDVRTTEDIQVRAGDIIIIEDDVMPENKIYIAIRTENNEFMLYNPNTYKYMIVTSYETTIKNTISLTTILRRLGSIYGTRTLNARVVERECVDYILTIKKSA